MPTKKHHLIESARRMRLAQMQRWVGAIFLRHILKKRKAATMIQKWYRRRVTWHSLNCMSHHVAGGQITRL